MCTIGNVFIPESKGLISFKQCDLKTETNFLEPSIEKGTDDIRYMPFNRVGSNGPWSGVNDYGVSFVAADAYMETSATGVKKVKDGGDDIFAAYMKIISAHKTAEAAAEYMTDFYKTFADPDILLINDATSAYFIEHKPGETICIKRTDDFFASTNHFRMLYGGVLFPQNHSTYLRLSRAEAILEKHTNATGPFRVLKDQYFGETVFSICRVNQQTPPESDPYYTQASSVFFSDGNVVNCAYQLNGNPRKQAYTVVQDVFGEQIACHSSRIEDLAVYITKNK